MPEKITGRILIPIGIIIMFAAAANLFLVFSGRSEPLRVFHLSGISLNAADLMPQTQLTEMSNGFATNSTIPSSDIQLFPAETINTVLNTIAHVIFMSFIVSLGYKIASLGAMLTRPIVVKVRGKTDTPDTPSPQAV